MRYRSTRSLLACSGLLLTLALASTTRAAETTPLRARDAIAPAAPILSANIVAALQERRYHDADDALALLLKDAKAPDDRAYFQLIRGIARRLDRRDNDARTVLADALRDAPRGPWAPRLRSALAALELANGHPDAAEALARDDAGQLLEPERKDRLAEVYHAFARSLLKPDDPVTPPDPNAAYDLLAQARALAKGPSLRARLLFAMARASQAAANHARAISDFQTYLRENPKGDDHAAARFHLAEAQRDAGQIGAARLTWADLARDLAPHDDAPRPRLRDDDFRALALYHIATTYGIPAPPDDTSLNLGVAALRRFLAAYPAHPLAVRAAYQVGAAYLARGKSQLALDALTAFLKDDGFRAETDDARRELAQLAMTASFQVAQVLQGQEQFAAATAAWKGYLAKFPDGPQSADAQRAILDTQLLVAADHLRRRQFAEARDAWRAFAADNPLDPRVPQVLFQLGDSFLSEELHDKAIAAWEPLLSKFPASEPAAHAQFLIAAIYEDPKGEPAAAIVRFKAVAAEPWKAQAAQRIAVMEAKTLVVLTPRTFRSGEAAHLKVTTRNLESLTFTAYKLSAEAYFRKKHALSGVEALDIGLVRPDAEWTVAVPGYARYKPVETTYPLAKLAVPGVWVVKVTDEKTLQATTLVLASDLDAIVKASQNQVLVFAQDMKTGRGRAGARVLIADGDAIVLEAKTGDDGVLLRAWDHPRAANAALRYLVLDGGDVAGAGLGVPERVAQGLSPRAYIATDRPAYRPGQQVALRGVVREVKDGQYANVAGAVYRLEVADSRGRQIVARPVTLSPFGTFHETLPLDEGAPVGTYRVRVYQPGKSDFAGQFEVQSYRLEKLDLSFDLKKTVYFRGETITGAVVARYQYGAPASGRPIAVQLPDGRVLRGTTDAEGKYALTFATESFAEEQALRLAAQLPQDGVSAVARVMLAVRAYTIALGTSRGVYLDGESFAVAATTEDAQGQPVGERLSLAVLKQVTQAGRVTEREVSRKELATDAKTGRGTASLKVEDARGGRYVIRASGTDRFGNAVIAERAVEVSGKEDATRLRILADRQSYRAGEEAQVNVHVRGGGGTALLAWEADRVLRYRVLRVEEGDNALSWPVEGSQFPNFTLTASRMSGTRFDEARLDVRVERDLRVSLRPSKPVVGPGDEVSVAVETRDQLGHPVSAEVSLALVDRSLLRLYGDRQPAIGTFFYDQVRTGAFTTESTNTFRYAPATSSVSEAVVEEAEQAAARLANEAERGQVIAHAKSPAAPAAPPAPEGVVISSDVMGGGPAIAIEGRPLSGSNGPQAADKKELALGELDATFSDGVIKEKSGALGRGAAIALGKAVDWGEEAKDRPLSFFAYADGGEVGLRRRSGLQSQPRQQFVETAYWNPAIVTDKDGKATVAFRAPTALSEYAFAARGVSANDTLVGQADARLAVRKPFFVDLKVPPTLTQGDRPRFLAQVHHVGVTGKASITLTLYADGKQTVLPKSLELKGDGVDEVLFDPFDVPDAESLRLTLAANLGDARDELVLDVPIRPWGVQAFASASGTASDDATLFVSLPPGRTYDAPEMLVVVSPTLQRLLIELALGRDAYPLSRSVNECLFPIPHDTTADRAGDLLAANEALRYLRNSRAAASAAAPEANRLTTRIQGLVSELIAMQNEDGGWPWISGARTDANPQQPNPPRPSDRLASARVVWALAAAEPLGLLTDPKALEKAATYLQQEFARAGGNDHDTRAVLLHALSTRRHASFEQANSLNRLRPALSDAALAYLALTFVNLDRVPMAAEVLDVLAPRARSEPVAPGTRPRAFWQGQSPLPFNRGPVEATALAALAFAAARPQADLTARAADWLLAHRQGTGWLPTRAKGPALAALAAVLGKAAAAEDRYNLVVSVNDAEVARIAVAGPTQGKAMLVPRKALKTGAPNRVRFDIEGRGTFGYAVTLTGFTRDFAPDQDRNGRSAVIDRRVYRPADPELDGKVLPTGFAVALNAAHFENTATQVARGGTLRVEVSAYRNVPGTLPEWERDALIVEEHLPAGTTLIDGSVQAPAGSYTLADGVLTFAFAPDQWPGMIRYDVHGALPGRYRALPPSIRSAYEPGRAHLGPAGALTVLAPGEPATDPYKPTPDELFARGKAHFDAARFVDAAAALEPLFAGYTLRDDIARDAARMLLLIAIRGDEPRKVVQYFEVVKEKAPELVIAFDDLKVIGRSYRAIGESERAYLVWRGVVEASYLEDARVGEVLRQRGRTLEGIAYLTRLWREYPGSAAIDADFFGLSQVLAQHAGRALSDPALRRELAAAGVTRSELLLQAIRLVQVFLAEAPQGPLADEASLALVGAFLELEDYEAVVRLASRFAALYPKSTFLDSFQYSAALGDFHLGRYDRAVSVAEAIAQATYKDASGVEQPSANKWQALYILGQIYDARRQPSKALVYYRQVSERFSDASGAIKALTRKGLTLPEVTVVRPESKPVAAAGVGLRAVAPSLPRGEVKRDKAGVVLDYRNVAEADVKVYPVDLMRLYLSRRSLDAIAGIDLAGITPLLERTIKLGDGEDFEDRVRAIDLELPREGAYLVMVRGDERYASGVVLVSPLELEVLEEAESGRVRVTVRDARTKEYVPKVQVKVSGSDGGSIVSGETDLRGVYVAEGLRGEVTAVARTGGSQYAFYRGTTRVGAPPAPETAAPAVQALPNAPADAAAKPAAPTLEDNLKLLNSSNQSRQIERLQERYKQGGQGGAAVKGFK